MYRADGLIYRHFPGQYRCNRVSAHRVRILQIASLRVARENANLSELPETYHSLSMAQDVHPHARETFDPQTIKAAALLTNSFNKDSIR